MRVGGLTVVKVGGSLLSDAPRLRAVLSGLADGRDGPCVVVPGGGPFAEAVRTSQAALGFDDALAHRLALDAMGRVAEIFRALEPRLRMAATEEAGSAILAQGGPLVWDPVALKAGHRDIPEDWSVTSDSLAVWLAARWDARRCVLIKAATVPVGASAQHLARLGLVDEAFPTFAARYRGEIVLRGAAETRAAA